MVRSYLIMVGDVLWWRVVFHWFAFIEHLLKSERYPFELHVEPIPCCWPYELM